ncbi:MAG: phosphotransferase family protein [Desulfobacterales bacterium]
MPIVDAPTKIRDGEELDQAAVESFLKQNIEGLFGSLEIKQFPSGFSNLTYFIRVGDREMVLRRPPFGRKAKTAHDMGREYKILSALYPVFPYCPKPLVYTEDESIMGCPFYVMERLQGIILRKDLPEDLSLAPADARRLCGNMVDLHVRLHSLDYEAIGLSDFGKPQGYVRRQVEGWSRRYRDARTPDVPDFEPVMAWLAANQPDDFERPAIIHNDYKFDNLVLNPDNPLEIIGILDWEMATLGDPLMDLGASLAYWINRDDPEEMQLMRTLPTTYEGMMTRREVVDRYAETAGIELGNFDFYYCFGLFRLAGIAQQIYYRYYHGQTEDERFIQLGYAVGFLENAAKRVIG